MEDSDRTGADRPRTCHDGLDRPRADQQDLPLSRRRFLQSAAMGAAGIAAGPHLLRPRAAHARGPSRIVRVHDENATTGTSTVNQEPVDAMVHTAIRALTGIPDTAAAWKSLFPGITPERTIGIKINLACGDVPTHPEVVNSMIDGLLMMDLGGQTLPPEKIIVWDADSAFMCPQTGYQLNWGGPGVQYVGTDYPGIGYDFSSPFVVSHGGPTTTLYPSRILSQYCDYLIDAAVMKDHDDWAGVTLTMKNWYGAVYNIYSTAMHYNGFNTGIPGISMALRDELGNKVKLYLLDATFGLYNGGPGYTPPYHTPPNCAPNSVVFGRDTVAIDRIGTEMINALRIEHGLSPLDPLHIRAASEPPYDLGNEDLGQIDLVNIELGAQALTPETIGPRAVALLAPYPNPMRDACTLRFHCAAAADVELMITDATGAVVRRLAAARQTPGMHRFHWNGRDAAGSALPSGTYFCRLRARGTTQEQQLVLVR